MVFAKRVSLIVTGAAGAAFTVMLYEIPTGGTVESLPEIVQLAGLMVKPNGRPLAEQATGVVKSLKVGVRVTLSPP